MKRTSLVLIVAGVAGCASAPPPQPVWQKPGSTHEEFASARLECLERAKLTVPVYDSSGPVTTDYNIFSACMGSRGWVLR